MGVIGSVHDVSPCDGQRSRRVSVPINLLS
jgi:hypothetical protein